ncbi:MAG: molybdate ABC transporter substrate-binding protein [Planctomycetes bacterium]|nr:molybdate ABC transporter substrate-binding protein [Planctomycetota bacterium]
MRLPLLATALLATSLAVGGCPAGRADGGAVLRVYAAASLREALAEAHAGWRPRPATPVELHYAGSGTLAMQILAAGRADLFIAAGDGPMDRVEAEGLLVGGTRVVLASNRLAVVAPTSEAGWPTGPASLKDPRLRRLAVADPRAVPAGAYARAFLEAEGLWEELGSRLAPAQDARAALAAVESGAADLGIVYRTDALASTRSRVIWEVSGDSAPRIAYPMAVLRGPREGEATALAGWLSGPEAQTALRRHGFLPASAGR